jgi:site-specific DNA recombinase
MSEILHIYTRVSSTVQEEDGTSLDTQKDLGIQKSKELGFDYKIWNEGGQSSSKDDLGNRPVLVELLNEVEDGNVKHLFVFNTDRLSRNDQTWTLIRLKLVQQNVTLYTSSGIFKLSDRLNTMFLTFMSEISSYDNYLRAERTRLGKINRIKQGYWMGGPPPFGYKIENKKLVENPDESKWLKFVYESYRDKKSIRWIKNELLKNNVKTRRGNTVWSLGSIEKLLQNTHYSGYYNYVDKKSGDSFRVECKSILPFSLYQDVKTERESRSRQKRVSESNLQHFYLLRDFLFCGECGSRYSGRIFKKQYRSVYYCPRLERNYVNEKTGRTQKCGNRRYLKIEETDKLVWNVVVEVMEQSNLFKEEVKTQIMGETVTHKDNKQDLRKLKRKLKRLDTDISDTTKSIVNLETDRILNRRRIEEVEEIIKNVEEVRIDLESQREEIRNQIHSIESEVRWVDWVGQFGDRINKMNEFTEEEKHQFLKGVIEKITVYTLNTQTHRLKLEFKIPYVNDSLQWIDENNKKLGYNLIDGVKEMDVEIDSLKKVTPGDMGS